MRVNEDQFHVLAAKAKGQATKCGYLYKKSGKKQAADSQTVRLQKRWYVLYYNLLFYYENESSPKPIGVIIIEGCSCTKFPDNKVVCIVIFASFSLKCDLFMFHLYPHSINTRDKCNTMIQLGGHLNASQHCYNYYLTKCLKEMSMKAYCTSFLINISNLLLNQYLCNKSSNGFLNILSIISNTWQ